MSQHMYVSIYASTHICMCIHTCVCIYVFSDECMKLHGMYQCVHLHLQMYACVYICLLLLRYPPDVCMRQMYEPACLSILVHICMHLHVPSDVCMCLQMYVSTDVSTHVCMYIYVSSVCMYLLHCPPMHFDLCAHVHACTYTGNIFAYMLNMATRRTCMASTTPPCDLGAFRPREDWLRRDTGIGGLI